MSSPRSVTAFPHVSAQRWLMSAGTWWLFLGKSGGLNWWLHCIFGPSRPELPGFQCQSASALYGQAFSPQGDAECYCFHGRLSVSRRTNHIKEGSPPFIWHHQLYNTSLFLLKRFQMSRTNVGPHHHDWLHHHVPQSAQLSVTCRTYSWVTWERWRSFWKFQRSWKCSTSSSTFYVFIY